MNEHEYVFKRFNTDGVLPGKNHRDLNEDNVKRLMDSIAKVGLRNPINVRQKTSGAPPVLISGAHRLEACKRLKLDTIGALVMLNETDIEAELASIDENLSRQNLSQADEALAVQRRAELVKALADEDDGGANAPASKQSQRRQGTSTGPNAASTRDLAAKTGRSKDSIRRAKTRAKELGTETLERVKDTSLDKGTELDALAKLPTSKRETLVSKAENGEKVSARPAPVSIWRKQFKKLIARAGADDIEWARQKLDETLAMAG